MINKILILGGATAVGKTALAIQWAQQFNGEIINADSRQIYRYMDIGTAKPSLSEQAAAHHHLIDVVNPDQTFSLAEYQEAAYAAIADIQARGRLPILAGGTGMYITATMEGWQVPEVPPDPDLRAQLEAMSKAELLDKLKVLDPLTVERIDADNPRRLVRAVEVCLLTGRPFSELRTKSPPNYDGLYFALTMERADLYARADKRVEIMLERGWLEEIERLQKMGFPEDAPAMTALGYPQMLAHLRGELALAEAVTAIQNATHRFIRRQYTWLRGHDAGWRWITPDEDAAPIIENWLAG
jgi:tRNA dimethylallyltransferase